MVRPGPTLVSPQSLWPVPRPGPGSTRLGHLPVAKRKRAHCGVRARLGTARARDSPHAHARPPPQCATPRGRRESRPRHSPEGSKGAGPPGRLRHSPPARARTRPHVSLRPRGMWVTEPSGLTCPRPPPPPQRPLCNAASRARPANRRPRAAERKHSAHVARAARPCEGGAGPAPPGRAAALQGAGRAAVQRPRGRRGNRARADTHGAAAHPTSPEATSCRRPLKCPSGL